MKKLLIASLALAGACAANAAVGGVAVQKGFALTNEYEVAGIELNTGNIRSGVGVNDKFYLPNWSTNKVLVYGKDGQLIKEISPAAGKYVWTSCNVDAAGHVLVQLDNHSFDGSCSANGGHGFMVIDSETDEIANEFLPMEFGFANRFDVMAPVDQNILTDYNTRILAPLNASTSSYQFSYNSMSGDEVVPGFWKVAAFATSAGLDQFCQGATAQTTTGYALQYTSLEGAKEAAILVNPYFSGSGQRGTFSAPEMFGNAIRRYTGNWSASADWFYTPMHAGVVGYNVFTLDGKMYIVYPTVYKNDASGLYSNPADAFAVAEVSYVASPKTDMAMEGEALVEGLPVGTLKAVVTPVVNGEGTPVATSVTSCAASYNVVPVEGDPNSVYIYAYNTQAFVGKWKFSVNVPEEQPSTATGEGTLESPYNVAKALEIIAAGEMTTDDVYVQGKIKSITELSTSYGNATYLITDEGSDNEFTIFRGYALGNQKFTAADEIAVGDDVVVLGKLVEYNGTPEMNTGNYIVKLNGNEYVEPAGPDFSDCTGTEEASIGVADFTLPEYRTDGYGFYTIKAEGATAPAYNANSNTLRIYANNTMTVYGGKLTKIEFVIGTTNAARYTTLTPSTGTVAEQSAYVDGTVGTWTGDATEVTFTVGALGEYGTESTKPGQIHIAEIIINKADVVEPVEPVEPTLGNVGEVLTQPGYELTPVYTVEGIDQSTSRSGVLYNDKVYVPNLFGNLVIYNVAGEVIKTIPPTEGYKMWTSCNLDAAGHLLVQIDNTTADVFGGTISADGGHGFMVIDTDTDEVILPFMQMKSSAQRYDCMAPVAKDLFTDEVVSIYETLANVSSSFRYLYNQRGVAEKPNWWDCKPMARTSEGIVATDAIPSLFPSPANKQTTTGYALEYTHIGDENFSILVYANPEYHVTYSAEGMYGNGIRKFTAGYVPTEQWYYTPQHSGLTGFNVFRLDGKEYIIYPAIDGNSAYNDPLARPADAFAIAEVSYVDGPATDMTMEGETLVDGKLAGTLKARAYGLLNEAGTAPVYQSATATAPAFTIVPVEGDSKSVYILTYNNGAPAAKWKFTVSESSGIDSVEAADTDAPAVYYNLQGVRVANPVKGLYIRVQGNKATKVVL